MKSYRFVVPIFLIAVFLLSFYALADGRKTLETEYDKEIKIARDCMQRGIYVDAEVHYKKALNKKPSCDLYMEMAEMYNAMGKYRTSVSWGKSITSKYPKDVRGYENLMKLYCDNKKYAECFELDSTFRKRGLKSETMDSLYNQIKYTFSLNGSYSDVGAFSGGLCPVKNNDKWGYVNDKGKSAISCTFDDVGPFGAKVAPVIDNIGNAYFVDQKGNKKFALQTADSIQKYGKMDQSGLYPAYNGSNWAFYNADEEFVFGSYLEASALNEGVAAVKDSSGWHIVNNSGEDLTGKRYDSILIDEKGVACRNGRLFVCKDYYYYMIDASGNQYGDKFENAHLFNDDSYAAVCVSGKWGFVNSDGNFVFDPQYSDARSFANGLAAVCVEGKWGYIDLQNSIVIEPQFADARDFYSSGVAFVNKRYYWSLLMLYKFPIKG